MKIKQIIIMRKDLNMRKGKMAAQAAHASMSVILNEMTRSYPSDNKNEMDMSLKIRDEALLYWLNGPFTKVVVSVDSEDELLKLYANAKNANLRSVLITDAGVTEFNGVPTHTCIAIGPNFSDDIDQLTGHLKLL